VASACWVACSSEIDTATPRFGANASNTAGGVGPVSSASEPGNVAQNPASPTAATGTASLFDVDDGLPGSGSGSGGEVCDGVDNDMNGVVDDVDVGGDGVCDCLNIATIGEIGPWGGGGNLFASWIDQRSPLGATALGDQVLTDEVLQPFQVIVVLYAATSRLDANGQTLQAHHEFSADEAAAFQRWIRAGGGVMTTAGYLSDEVSEVANVNRLLQPFGVGYSTTELNLDGFVQSWEPHPVTTGISRINTSNGVATSGGGTLLARDGGMRLALEVAEPELGHVLVWGDEWITYDSEWRDVQDQQVERLWLNALSWLSPVEQCQVPIPTSIR
jgi:hypothetical protein